MMDRNEFLEAVLTVVVLGMIVVLIYFPWTR